MAKNKKKLDYDALAQDIVSLVGGKENVNSVRHCITRCRFRLKDESIADDEAIKKLNGVVSVVKGGGEYMVVIGNEVEDVYNAVCKVLGMADGVSAEADASETGEKKNLPMRILNIVMGAVAPALNMICAGGVLKGILSILSATGLLTETSGFYLVLNAMGDAVFVFLPIVLGYNLAKTLGGDGFLGLIIGAILCYPGLQGVTTTLFGIETTISYTSSFLPVVLVTAVAVPLSKWVRGWAPKAIAGFFVPTLTLLAVMPLGFAFIGPAATALGNVVNDVITVLMNTVPLLAGAVFGGLYQVLVLFGIHQAVTSFSFMNILAGNPDYIMAIGCLVSFAQIGVALAMYLKTRDQNLKDVALPAFLSGVFGVTEPAIYGVTLPRIKMFVLSCIGGAVTGVYCMATRTIMYHFTGLGIMTIMGLLNAEASNIIFAIGGAVVPFVFSFVTAMILFKDETAGEAAEQDTEDETAPVLQTTVIIPPVPGKVIPVENVPDETFSTGLLGHGFAIEPSEGKVFAPFDGVCVQVFETLHAMNLLSDGGAEVLIHVGLETVSLNGEPFKAHVKSGDRIKKGQLLLEFDMDLIRERGCPTVVPVLVTNADDFDSVSVKDGSLVAEVSAEIRA